MDESGAKWWVAVGVLAAAGVIAVYLFRDELIEVQEPVVDPTPSVEETTEGTAPAGPEYPVSPPERSGELIALPPLDESDRYFELELIDLFGSGIDDLLADTALIEKIVATVDSLPHAEVAERIRPIAGVDGPFSADGQDGSGEYTVNPANYARYDFLVNLLALADVDSLAATYRRFYPLFQQAYVDLGYPNGHFNDRAVQVLDHLLETPSVDEPVTLVRPHVLYEYADPDLEAASSGQKLLLRLGGDHRVRVLQFVEELRDAITELDVQAVNGGDTL